MSLNLSFPDQTYTAANEPSVETMKADLTAIETEVNAHEADTTIHIGASSTLTILAAAYPVGSVYTSVLSTSPATLLGFGTWSQIAGGKFLAGQTVSDTDFDTAEETGGAKTADISHVHTGPSHTHTGPSHTHTGTTSTQAAGGGGGDGSSNTKAHAHTFTSDAAGTGNTGAGGDGNTGSAGSATQSILNPYFVVYFWKRTA